MARGFWVVICAKFVAEGAILAWVVIRSGWMRWNRTMNHFANKSAHGAPAGAGFELFDDSVAHRAPVAAALIAVASLLFAVTASDVRAQGAEAAPAAAKKEST